MDDQQGDLGGTYFDADLPGTQLRPWFNVDGGSTQPQADGRTLVEVAIVEGDTADDVAEALRAALDALPNVMAARTSNVVMLNSAYNGYSPPIVDGDTPTGFTFSLNQSGTERFDFALTQAAVEAIGPDGGVWRFWGTPPSGIRRRVLRGDVTWKP